MKALPVFKTSFKSVGYAVSNSVKLFEIILPWVGIYGLFTLLFQLLGIDDYYELERSVDYVTRFPEDAQKNGYENLSQLQFKFETLQAQLGIAAVLHSYLDKLLLALAFSATGVAWYRGFLMSENPPRLRFGALEFKFFVYLIIYAVAGVALFFLVYYFIREYNIIGQSSSNFTALVLGLLMVLFAVRFQLVLVGVSVGDKRMNPLMSWRVTKGNSWRLYGGLLLILVISIPIWVAKTVIGSFELPIFIDWPLQAFLSLLVAAVLFSFTAICYQLFVPPPKTGDLE